MGVEPYLVASSLEAVLAQRLVRVLCKHCKLPDTSPTTAAIKAQIGIPTDTTVFRGVGCRECRNTGYHGRHAIFEWMDIDNDLRQLVLKNVSSGEIAAQARRSGLRVLSEDGWRLVRKGITTPEEVLRVTKDSALNNIAPEAEPKPSVEVQPPRKSHAAV
jgi:type II secretory ATPase GspE/PulE/Tfp pilus assembly ATPase PilB-like protein